jgi:hypothetical protein
MPPHQQFAAPISNPSPHAQVMGFWSKAQRVVGYKVRSEAAAKKKEVMDKQVGGWVGSWLGWEGRRGLQRHSA